MQVGRIGLDAAFWKRCIGTRAGLRRPGILFRVRFSWDEAVSLLESLLELLACVSLSKGAQDGAALTYDSYAEPRGFVFCDVPRGRRSVSSRRFGEKHGGSLSSRRLSTRKKRKCSGT